MSEKIKDKNFNVKVNIGSILGIVFGSLIFIIILVIVFIKLIL